MASLSTYLDRTGVLASVFCAIHCAVAPVLLIAAPTLGGLWVHPLSHLAIAALVLPIAAVALRSGFRTHGRRWVVALGGVGIALIVIGAALPYFFSSTTHASEHATACTDCCPTFVVDEATGAKTLKVPPASIVTLIGGTSLIIAHLANLRCCAHCHTATPATP